MMPPQRKKGSVGQLTREELESCEAAIHRRIPWKRLVAGLDSPETDST